MIRSGAYRDIFEVDNTIRGLIAGVVVPNLVLVVHACNVEAFEDMPLEYYVRAELQVSEVATTSRCRRRQGARGRQS